MTVLELVDRERARLRKLHVLLGLAAAVMSEKLAPAGPRLAPGEQRMVGRGAMQAAIAAVVAIVALAFAAPQFNDGLLAIMRPVSAWDGTLLPRIMFSDLPPAVLRG